MSQILLGWEQPNVDQIENKFGQRGFPVFYAQERHLILFSSNFLT